MKYSILTFAFLITSLSAHSQFCYPYLTVDFNANPIIEMRYWEKSDSRIMSKLNGVYIDQSNDTIMILQDSLVIYKGKRYMYGGSFKIRLWMAVSFWDENWTEYTMSIDPILFTRRKKAFMYGEDDDYIYRNFYFLRKEKIPPNTDFINTQAK